MKLAGILLLFATIATLALHERYRIEDDRTPNDGSATDLQVKKRWHFLKGLFQAEVAALVGLLLGWPAALLFAAGLTVLHDAYINVTVLGKTVDYIGSTAWFDQTLLKVFTTQRRAFIFKLLVLALTVILYFLN